MNEIIISCYTTDKLMLEKLSIKLIENKLASCISIFKNIKFTCNYRKKIFKEKEYRMFIKTKNKNIFSIKKQAKHYGKFLIINIYDR